MRPATANAIGIRLAFGAAAILFASGLSGCSTQINPQELLNMVPLKRQEAQPPPPVPETVRQDSEKNSTRIRAEQVVPVSGEASRNERGSRVSQITNAPDAGATLHMEIDADDPCLGELQDTEQCQMTLAPASGSASSSSDSGMALTIVSPETGRRGTFDAARAVNEIGRGKTLSQAAQSAGSDFLAGAAPTPPDTPAPDLPGVDVPPGTVVTPPQ
jgi:hypothetical protein